MDVNLRTHKLPINCFFAAAQKHDAYEKKKRSLSQPNHLKKPRQPTLKRYEARMTVRLTPLYPERRRRRGGGGYDKYNDRSRRLLMSVISVALLMNCRLFAHTYIAARSIVVNIIHLYAYILFDDPRLLVHIYIYISRTRRLYSTTSAITSRGLRCSFSTRARCTRPAYRYFYIRNMLSSIAVHAPVYRYTCQLQPRRWSTAERRVFRDAGKIERKRERERQRGNS